MDNVVTIKRHQKQPYPDFWPKVGYNAAVYTLFRQLPTGAQNYHYAIKTDINSAVFSIIVQPNKSVLYQTASKSKSENAGFNRWFNLNLGALRTLSTSGFAGTIVGKMSVVDGRDLFCVYYVVQGDSIIVDSRTMESLLNTRENDFDGTMVLIPVMKVASINVDINEGTIRSTDLIKGLAGAIVGIPAVNVELRLSEDGTEADVPAKILSTGIHMRFMGFTHVFEKD